jgi:uncharacterized protein (TIGR02271 family)
MTPTTQRATLVAVFSDRAKAQQAINDLKQAGFRDDQIGVTSREADGAQTAATTGDNYAAEAGAAGLATGAGVGALWGLGIVSGVLPAIGPAIAGGTLAAILSSAAAGAAAAGLAGSLIGMGIPKDEAEYYESEFKAGRTLVTVKTEGRGAEAITILRRHGGYEKGSESAACAPAQPSHSVLAGGQQTVQAREEQLRVQKHRERAGEVTVRKEVHTEHKTIDVPVEREEVVVERRPVSGRAAATGTLGDRQQITVPVTEEHVEVTKTPVVKEEVTVGKRKVTGSERVAADVKKEQIKVEKEGDACIKDQPRR